MSKRRLFLRVGSEAPRGPLDESAILESLKSGVVPADAEIADGAEGPFRPAAELFEHAARARQKTTRTILYALVAAGALGAIAGGVALYSRARPPKLCEATPRVLAALPQTLAIDAYVTRGSPKLDAFALSLERLLRAYEAAAPKGKVSVRVIDVKDDVAKAAAKEAGLTPQAFGEASDDLKSAKITQGYSGIVLRYGAEQATIKFLPPDDSADGAEFWITSKIREIHALADHAGYRIGLASGHHEDDLGAEYLVPSGASRASMKSIITQNFSFYAFDSVDLTKDEVDPKLAGLLITQPEDDFDDAALARIDAAVMRGQSLVVVASAVNVRASDPAMTVTLGAHNLPKLLSSYGIDLHEDLLFDPSGESYQAKTTSGTVRFPFIPVAKASPTGIDGTVATGQLDDRSAIFFRANTAVFPFASSLTLDKTKQPLATYTLFAKTSVATTPTTTTGKMWLRSTVPPGPSGAAIVSVSAEGTMTSAFGHGKSTKPVRVLVISSAGMFSNPFARAVNAPHAGTMLGIAQPTDESVNQIAMSYAQSELTQTILTFKNTLDWMASDDDLAKCIPERPKEKGK